MSRRDELPEPEVLDPHAHVSLGELCRVFDVHADYVIELVEVGVVEPLEGRRPSEWRFPAHSIVRMRRALRLSHDLAVEPAGAALALDLIEEVRALRARVRALETGNRGG
jgi:chaperone modulatory protein CbpM